MVVGGHATRKELRKYRTCLLDSLGDSKEWKIPIKTRRENLNHAEIKTEQLSRNEVRHLAIRIALERESFGPQGCTPICELFRYVPL